MVKVLTEGSRNGEHIVSEAGGATGGMRSREVVTLASGALGVPGMVLGMLSASGKYVPLTATAADPATGSEVAAAVLWGHVDATDADAAAVVHMRECEVNGALLVWPAGITSQAKTAAIAALASKGIIVR